MPRSARLRPVTGKCEVAPSAPGEVKGFGRNVASRGDELRLVDH